jgi:hypothetical protein
MHCDSEWQQQERALDERHERERQSAAQRERERASREKVFEAHTQQGSREEHLALRLHNLQSRVNELEGMVPQDGGGPIEEPRKGTVKAERSSFF